MSVHSVFGIRTFLSHPLIYLLEVLYKYLSWCSTNSIFVQFDQLLRELLQEARSQCPLPSLCFSEPIGKTRWRPCPLIGWDIFDFSETNESLFMEKLANKICLNNQWIEFNETWQETRFYSSFTEFVFFRPIGKTRWPPWPLIGWDILDFFSETVEQNSTTSPKNFSFCNSRFLRVAHSLIQPIRMKSTVTYT